MTLSAHNVRAVARELGLELVGITKANRLDVDEERYLSRIDRGLLSGLAWLTRERARHACAPRQQFTWACSIISVAWPYPTVVEADAGETRPRGRVARYAWGSDYHNVLGNMLEALASALRSATRGSITRISVDTGRIAERAFALRAGLGWFGKNGNILTRSHGSWVLLGEVLTELDIDCDEPSRKSCGNCTICLKACPTGALIEPYVLDSGRCIAYLTIEHRGGVPRELREKMGKRVFGCDICQEVCPVNHRVPGSAMPDGRWVDLDLVELLTMGEQQYRARFAGSALTRAKLAGLQRNAAIALGNIRASEGVRVLAERLEDGSPSLRAHAAWALGRITDAKALKALSHRRTVEQDRTVREEIDFALEQR